MKFSKSAILTVRGNGGTSIKRILRPLNQPSSSWPPRIANSLASAQDYSSFGGLQLLPLSALLRTVDHAGVSPRFAKHGENLLKMRRKPSPTSASQVIRDDNHHPFAGGSRSRADRQQNPRKVTGSWPEVVDDFPEIMPVMQPELDVIETYLGSLLDDLLRHNS